MAIFNSLGGDILWDLCRRVEVSKGYIGTVIRNELLESKTLQQQAVSNSKEQFARSPDLARAHQDAIIDALDTHQAMNSPDLQPRMLALLLGNFNLWEGLRKKAVVD
jgi:type I restriction enzyme R subunit